MTEQTMQELLTESYDYDPPKRGQFRKGIILALEDHGATIDLGLKREGLVPRDDLERLGEEKLSELKPNQEVTARVMKAGHFLNDELILSLYEAQKEEAWEKAQKMLDEGELYTAKVTGYNKGGLLVNVEQLEGFVPASHLARVNKRHMSGDQRRNALEEYIGEELSLKFLEVNSQRRRLILSERLAREEMREQNMDHLLSELLEGEVHRGTVRHLANFGAFVDLGGADGLIHNSELSWRRIRHPSEVVQVGDEIEVYVLKLDHKRKRIDLSLKRLQPNPWVSAYRDLEPDQLIQATITNLVDFGAFAALDVGIEGLIHISELAEPEPEHPREVVQRGEKPVLRILRIDPFRQRLALSLKSVSEQEREAWLAQQEENTEPVERARDVIEEKEEVEEEVEVEKEVDNPVPVAQTS